MPTDDTGSPGYLILSHLGLAKVLMLRPVFQTLVMFPEFKFRLIIPTQRNVQRTYNVRKTCFHTINVHFLTYVIHAFRKNARLTHSMKNMYFIIP